MGMTERLAVIKCYLNLFHNVLNVSYDTILKLEQTDLVPTEVYDMMNSLESKLQWSIDSKLLGYKRSSSKNTSLQEQCEGFYSVVYVCSHFWFHILITANKIIFTLDNHFLWGRKRKDFTTGAEELWFYRKLNWDSLMRNIGYIIHCKVKWRVCVMYFKSLEFGHGIFIYLQSSGSFSFLQLMDLIMPISTSNAEVEQIISLDKQTEQIAEDHKISIMLSLNFKLRHKWRLISVIRAKSLMNCFKMYEKNQNWP